MFHLKTHILLALAFTIFSLQATKAQGRTDSIQYYKWTLEFESKKGKLPCPFAEGTIDYKVLYLDAERKPTRGMDLLSDNSEIKNCMDGRVVAAVQGKDDWSLIIAHGDYFCVYSNLESVSVTSGQMINAGQIIGKALKHPTQNTFVMHLEIWKGIEHLWPADWLACSH